MATASTNVILHILVASLLLLVLTEQSSHNHRTYNQTPFLLPRSGYRRQNARRKLLQRKLAKFLSLLTVVRFPNEPCITTEGLTGTCYHRLECATRAGTAGGPCAHGFGVCCYFLNTCGSSSQQNCSYFINPGFPSAFSGSLNECKLTVEKQHPDVTQLRLDFKVLELFPPENGTCDNDRFVVSGQNMNSIVPIICGSNTDQHVYVDIDSSMGPYQLSVQTSSNSFPRRFKVKVTQILPGNKLESPKNCLQYYTGVSGIIQSFNYEGTKPGYLNNLNYAICIRKEDGFCSITYTNNNTFQILNIDDSGDLVIPPRQAGAEVSDCPDDYIVISGIRLCGERLNDASVNIDFTQNAPVTDVSNGPFIVTVRSNERFVGRGFQLNYLQNLCMVNVRKY